MTDLLHTKLTPPQPRAPIVPRPDLVARLDAARSHRLALLAAPTGFGKTTLACAWLAELRRAGRAPALAWVTLDAGDNDPVRFWSYVAAACQALDPQIGGAALELLRGPQPLRPDLVLTALLNDLARAAQPIQLVFEDYHTISVSQIHEGVAALLEQLPACAHLVVLARSDPPLPLGRLRAHNQLVELRAADLRFSSAETALLLQQAVASPLPPEIVAQLAERTEGWPAALRLATLALQSRHEPEQAARLLASFDGSHQHVVTYLVAEVLEAQPEPLQLFLLETSMIGRLTSALCDAVREAHDSAAMIEAAEAADLFLTRIDERREWYRYHTLFGEAMRHVALQRLGVGRVRELQRRAGRWYAAHGHLSEAVEAALSAQDFAYAAALIDQILARDEPLREARTIRRWADQLPAELRPRHPLICFTYAMAILFTEDRGAPATIRRLEAPLELAERAWESSGDRPRLGMALALRSLAAFWQGERAQAYRAARHALALLPEDNRWWRAVGLMNLGCEALDAGRPNAAEPILLEARAQFEQAENGYGVRAALFTLADAAVERGEAGQAAQLLRQVIEIAGDDDTDRGQALLRLAGLAYARNELDQAEVMLAQAAGLGAQAVSVGGAERIDPDLVAGTALLRARLLAARGASAEAQLALAALAAQALQRGGEQLRREVRAEQARLALALGNTAAVRRWATHTAQHSEDVSRLQQEREALLVARWLIARGEPDAALPALERWYGEAQAEERVRSEVEILGLVALAHAAAGRVEQALPALSGALAQAQASGALRVFLDAGAPMRRLLQQALAHGPHARLPAPQQSFAHRLLAAFAQPEEWPGQPAPSARPPGLDELLEPLSQQEQRVLRLLRAGLSNAEIADELVVSVNTVKTHVQHIYRKLGVTSRREARAAARDLRLS